MHQTHPGVKKHLEPVLYFFFSLPNLELGKVLEMKWRESLRTDSFKIKRVNGKTVFDTYGEEIF
jgi:hypothetical protein